MSRSFQWMMRSWWKTRLRKSRMSLPAPIESGLVLFPGRSMAKGVLGEKRTDAGAGVGIVEETRPETEGEFGDDPPRRGRLPVSVQSGFGFRHLVLLPGREPC